MHRQRQRSPETHFGLDAGPGGAAGRAPAQGSEAPRTSIIFVGELPDRLMLASLVVANRTDGPLPSASGRIEAFTAAN